MKDLGEHCVQYEISKGMKSWMREVKDLSFYFFMRKFKTFETEPYK